MKKKLLLIIMMMVLGMMTSVSVVRADTGDIPLDKKHFPDANMRRVLYQQVDRNGDEILQSDEIERITYLSLYAPVDSKENNDVVINTKGLGYLKNLKSIYLHALGYDEKKFGKEGIKNFINGEDIYQLQKLEKIKIGGAVKLPDTFDFSKFKNLKQLVIKNTRIPGGNNVIINNSKLKKIYFSNAIFNKLKITNCKNVKEFKWGTGKLCNGTLDLSSMKNLNHVVIRADIKKYKFGKLKKLKKISLYNYIMSNNSPRVDNLDLSNVINLQELMISDVNIKNIKFGKQKKLKKIWISGAKSLKKLDVSKLSGLKDVVINKCNKLKEIKFSKKGKLKGVSISECKKLKKIDLRNVSVKSLRLDKYTKAIKK